MSIPHRLDSGGGRKEGSELVGEHRELVGRAHNASIPHGTPERGVCTRTPANWGLYDTLGNVAESVTLLDGGEAVAGGSFKEEAQEVHSGQREAYHNGAQPSQWNYACQPLHDKRHPACAIQQLSGNQIA